MKKLLSVFMSLVMGCGIGMSLIGCDKKSGQGPVLNEYDVSAFPADEEFHFETSLPEAPENIFPKSSGRVFYVSAEGTDSANGLNKSTPMSLNAANQIQLRAGDSILLKGGDVFLNQSLTLSGGGEKDNPIYVGVYDGHLGRPNIVYGSEGAAVKVENMSNVVIEGLEVTLNATMSVGTSGGCYGILLDYRDYKVGDATGFKNLYVVDNVIHGGDDINVDTFGIRMLGTTDYPENDPQSHVENVWIVNNKVYNVGINGIASSWENWGAGRTEHNGVSRDVYSNIHIDSNTVYNVGYIGIIEQSTKNSTINRNVVYKTGQTTSGVTYSGDCGIMTISCEDVEVAFNETYQNERAHYDVDAMGIDIDWNCKRIHVRYNYSYNNQGAGIGTMACNDCVISDNKIADGLGLVTHNFAYIAVSDFTNYAVEQDEELRSVKNLKVENNLLIANRAYSEESTEDLTFFAALSDNGRGEWEGNSYTGNHVVSRIKDKSEKIIWNDVSPSRDWYEFVDNRYYGLGGSEFSSYDSTPQEKIAPGATALLSSGIAKTFAEWSVRDIGSAYEKVSYTEPGKIDEIKAVYSDGKINISWDAQEVWHYNVYLVGENEKQAYANMTGEVTQSLYSFEPKYKGEFYIVIEPESDTGVLGRPVKIKLGV